MKQLLSIILLLVCVSCIHAKIHRISRHNRLITINGLLESSAHRMYIHLKSKANVWKCKEVEVLEIVDGSHIKALCIGYTN